MIKIEVAKTQEQVRKCYPVMKQLRTHLSEEAFTVQAMRQIAESPYTLAFLTADDRAVSVAGFRIWENLCNGKHLYIDDLVSDEGERSKGYGEQLFDWVVQHARQETCKRLTLDSGVQRFAAHRFYLRKRMNIFGHHFSMDL